MSTIDEILATDGEAAEQYDNSQPLPDHAEDSRPDQPRSQMFSVRLSPEEIAELTEAAKTANLPARTLARAWILDRLNGKTPPNVDELAARVARLEQAVYRNQTTAKAG